MVYYNVIKPKNFNLKKGCKLEYNIENRLNSLNICLPEPSLPAANYVSFTISNSFIFVSGQISQNAQGLILGKIGKDLSLDDGYNAARQCGISLLSQLKKACDGDLNKITKVLKLTGFVNSTDNFVDHPKVINGASDLMVEVFGKRGSHSRAAVGCSSLPMGVAVEVEGIFQINQNENF